MDQTKSHTKSEDSVGVKPVLASDVTLLGELKGSGFRDSQWLAERDGRFIQLSELLYRVAEHADGNRTLDEIAEAVTGTTDWLVSASDIDQLVQRKLAPLGLLVPNGRPDRPRVTDPAGPAPPSRGRPQFGATLQVRARLGVIGPRVINPVTRVLRFLFTPEALIVALPAVAIAQARLFISHGVVASVSDVLYHPALFLIVVGALLLAAAFHEFGHASALRYGGGNVREMGVGLYLIFPTFYTNVTDSYRLDRKSRLRTDLGGIYFHLLTTLVLTGLSLMTRQEFLLLIVVL